MRPLRGDPARSPYRSGGCVHDGVSVPAIVALRQANGAHDARPNFGASSGTRRLTGEPSGRMRSRLFLRVRSHARRPAVDSVVMRLKSRIADQRAILPIHIRPLNPARPRPSGSIHRTRETPAARRHQRHRAAPIPVVTHVRRHRLILHEANKPRDLRTPHLLERNVAPVKVTICNSVARKYGKL